jgi:hypothetical protein
MSEIPVREEQVIPVKEEPASLSMEELVARVIRGMASPLTAEPGPPHEDRVPPTAGEPVIPVAEGKEPPGGKRGLGILAPMAPMLPERQTFSVLEKPAVPVPVKPEATPPQKLPVPEKTAPPIPAEPAVPAPVESTTPATRKKRNPRARKKKQPANGDEGEAPSEGEWISPTSRKKRKSRSPKT